jgi:hypothetical protein
MKRLIEINDKDDHDQKTTFFVLMVESDELIPKIQNAIADTWKIEDYDVRTLKSNLDKIAGIEYVYDCTAENPSQVLEMGL